MEINKAGNCILIVLTVSEALNYFMDDFPSRAVRAFKALADPTRYKIVCLLVEKGELGCRDFDNQFSLSKPALSHHYRILENAGLIVTRKEGNHIYTRINHSVLDELVPGFAGTHLKLDTVDAE